MKSTDSKRFLQLSPRLRAGSRVRAVDFREQRRQDGRTRRDLDDLDRRMRGNFEPRQSLANVERDCVARAGAFALRLQVDGKVAHLRLVAQIIMAHQPVEVERRGSSGIGLDRGQFRQVLEAVGGRSQNPVGRLERRAFRQIDDDLDFRLVVEGQQLDDAHPWWRRANRRPALRGRREIKKIFERQRPFSSGVATRV